MYCRKCGKEVAETSAFCPNCGERIGKEATAKKKIQISRKTCIATVLLVVLLLGSVAIYLMVIKKGDIHIESLQMCDKDGEPYFEYEIDSKEKKILIWYYGELWREAFYCIGNNEIELLIYDGEGDEQGKEIIRFETENRGKTAYIAWNEEGGIDWVNKICLTEDNVVTVYGYNDGEEELMTECKIEGGRVIGKRECLAPGNYILNRDFAATCEIEENELKFLWDESPSDDILTATDKIGGDDDIAELIFERDILLSIQYSKDWS